MELLNHLVAAKLMKTAQRFERIGLHGANRRLEKRKLDPTLSEVDYAASDRSVPATNQAGHQSIEYKSTEYKSAEYEDRGSAITADGGHDRDRTCDPYHVKVVLSR
jgi:hypothetical protein